MNFTNVFYSWLIGVVLVYGLGQWLVRREYARDRASSFTVKNQSYPVWSQLDRRAISVIALTWFLWISAAIPIIVFFFVVSIPGEKPARW